MKLEPIEPLSVNGEVFAGSHIKASHTPGQWTIARNLSLDRITHINCSLHGILFDSVSVHDLSSKGSSPLFLWCCVYRHAALSGRIAGLKLNRRINVATLVPPEIQEQWDSAVKQFYDGIDWALDISKARFTGGTTFEAIPGDKIVRNSEHQVLVRRSTLLSSDWKTIGYKRTAFDIALGWFLEDSLFDSVVLAARIESKYAREDVGVLNLLRREGLAE